MESGEEMSREHSITIFKNISNKTFQRKTSIMCILKYAASNLLIGTIIFFEMCYSRILRETI